jgi:hypothetical protein
MPWSEMFEMLWDAESGPLERSRARVTSRGVCGVLAAALLP